MPDSNQPLSDRPLSDEEILVKHAFRGSSFAVIRLEELTEIGNLKADAVACYRPVNAQEIFAVERIALCQQKMLRGERLESGLFTTALDYCIDRDGHHFRVMSDTLAGDGDIEITRPQNRNFALGEGFRIMVKESDVWSIMLRYQVNAERQYRRAVEDFERLKRMRPQMPNHPDVGTEPDVIDDIAPIREINPRLPREPEPSEVEPAATLPVETPDAPQDGTPLAPAAASTPKTRRPVSHSGAQPEASRFKVKPVAPLRRSNNSRPAAHASKSRRPACRPVAKPTASRCPRSASSGPDSQNPLPAASIIVDSAA